MQDYLVRLLTRDGHLRACAARTSELVEETRRRQGTDPTASVAIGRLATGAALLSSQLKDNQRLALVVEANGPLQRLQAETDAAGHLRASLKVPVAGLPPRQGQYDVAGAVGRAGFLHVIKDLGLKEPYRGMVQLYSSEIAEDLAYYFMNSEQIPSSLGLGVTLAADGRVACAGGFLLQAMPGCPDALLSALEARLRALPPTTDLLQQGLSPEAILERLLDGHPTGAPQRTELRFRCSCSRRQTARVLHALGAEELRRLADEQSETSVSCEFCKQSYRFTRSELLAIAAAGGA